MTCVHPLTSRSPLGPGILGGRGRPDTSHPTPTATAMTKTSVSIVARVHAEKTDKTVLAAIAAAHADTPAATR